MALKKRKEETTFGVLKIDHINYDCQLLKIYLVHREICRSSVWGSHILLNMESRKTDLGSLYQTDTHTICFSLTYTHLLTGKRYAFHIMYYTQHTCIQYLWIINSFSPSVVFGILHSRVHTDQVISIISLHWLLWYEYTEIRIWCHWLRGSKEATMISIKSQRGHNSPFSFHSVFNISCTMHHHVCSDSTGDCHLSPCLYINTIPYSYKTAGTSA